MDDGEKKYIILKIISDFKAYHSQYTQNNNQEYI